MLGQEDYISRMYDVVENQLSYDMKVDCRFRLYLISNKYLFYNKTRLWF